MADVGDRSDALAKKTNRWLRQNDPHRARGLRIAIPALICAVIVLLLLLAVVGATLIHRDASLHDANAAKDALNRQLIATLRAHGIKVPPGAAGGPGAPGGNGGQGGVGGRGGPGGHGGRGGPGGRGGNGGPGGIGGPGGNGGNGAAVTVVLTPAPGPEGSPGAQGPPGAQGDPGPSGPPGPDECQWQDDPIRPGYQICTRPSPTPSPSP